MASNDSTAVQVNKSGGTAGANQTLNFTAMTWNTAQTITVSAVEDADRVSETVTVTHSTVNANIVVEYDNAADVRMTVSVQENDWG